MESMFYGAQAYNQPMHLLDTSNVTSMSEMFSGAKQFNYSIDSFNTSKCIDMRQWHIQKIWNTAENHMILTFKGSRSNRSKMYKRQKLKKEEEKIITVVFMSQ
jgi:hypothetical protein